ncbi:MAG TPA: CBS domain-containing protein [Chloroflexi bacterium]|nr:CBS domain-containing protein [Chloroflexota bacterium]
MSEITRLQELAYELKIAEVMTRQVVTVAPQTSMAELREILRKHRISGTPVVKNGELVGIVSVEDLIEALAAGEMGATIGEKMTQDPVVLRADDLVVLAVDYFDRYGFGRFPIVDEEDRLVGILTQGDITRGLLLKLGAEYHEEEIRRYRASHIFEDIVSDRTGIFLHYDVVARDFDHAGEAASKIKRALSHLGASSQIVRRAAIAAYEAEMNIILHTDEGGEIVVEVQPERITIRAVDTGPGIPDVEQAMQPGFSTAPEWVREMGFGAGMGLLNIKRCADEMRLESPQGRWTSLEAVIYLGLEGSA